MKIYNIKLLSSTQYNRIFFVVVVFMKYNPNTVCYIFSDFRSSTPQKVQFRLHILTSKRRYWKCLVRKVYMLT